MINIEIRMNDNHRTELVTFFHGDSTFHFADLDIKTSERYSDPSATLRFTHVEQIDHLILALQRLRLAVVNGEEVNGNLDDLRELPTD
jgi:hypothetical protein